MPFKDPDRKRTYFRDYMAARRGSQRTMLNLTKREVTEHPEADGIRMVKFNARKPHRHTMTKVDGKWRRTVEQDGLTYDRDTGELINVPS
ncbi:MAG: hypothetical protein AB9873_18375 [Syntrophobacteraceae bacterium]